MAVTRHLAALLAALLLASCAGQTRQREAVIRPSVEFGHVAIAVSDLERSSEWYRDAFGFQRIGDVYRVSPLDDSALGKIARALFPRQRDPLRIAQLKTVDGVAVELFEFEGRPHRTKNADASYLHLALVTNSHEESKARLAALGARPLVENANNPSRKVSFYQDPDGNVIELSSRAWDSPH